MLENPYRWEQKWVVKNPWTKILSVISKEDTGVVIKYQTGHTSHGKTNDILYRHGQHFITLLLMREKYNNLHLNILTGTNILQRMYSEFGKSKLDKTS